MKKILLIFTLFLFSIVSYAQDNQIWSTINLSGTINNSNFKILAEGEDRYSDASHNIKYFHYDLGILYKISSKFSIGGYYREIYENGIEFSIRIAQPHLDGFYKAESGFKFRTRIEYQIYKNVENQFRFRFRPAWQFKFWKNYNPFIQSEIFISQKYDLTRNRLTIGNTINIGKNIQIQPNYTLESNNKNIWQNRDILWINTKLKF